MQGEEIRKQKLPHRPNDLSYHPLVLCSNDHGQFDEVYNTYLEFIFREKKWLRYMHNKSPDVSA